MNEAIMELKKLVDGSDNIVFFGGAGVSTESGIKDFRSVDGLYRQKFKYPPETMLGALVNYITDESVGNFQPMGANMGILPPLEKKIRHKDERYAALAERAIAGLEAVL